MNPDKVAIDYFIQNKCSELVLSDNPLAESLNVVLVKASRGEIELSFDVSEKFTQGGGVIQGGVLAIMIDFGLAFSALSVIETSQSVATASININYYKAAYTGRYRVKANVDKQGRKIIFSTASLLNEAGDIVASASSPLVVVNLI